MYTFIFCTHNRKTIQPSLFQLVHALFSWEKRTETPIGIHLSSYFITGFNLSGGDRITSSDFKDDGLTAPPVWAKGNNVIELTSSSSPLDPVLIFEDDFDWLIEIVNRQTGKTFPDDVLAYLEKKGRARTSILKDVYHLEEYTKDHRPKVT